jgi:hypothetical protein
VPDQKPNPIRVLDHPAFYAAGSVVAILGNVFGYLDFYYMLFLLAVAIYGSVIWFRKKPSV